MLAKTMSRLSALSLIIAALVLACSDGGVTPPDATGPTGTLAIRVAGLPATAASGGSAQVLRTDVRGEPLQAVPIPPNGSFDLTLVAGTYYVSYLAPGGYHANDPNPLVGLSVAAHDTTVAQFTVYLAQGTLVIEVDVVAAPYPASGGSASVLRTDIGGQTPLDLEIPNNITEGYFAVVSLLPGTYTVTYTPPPGYTLVGAFTNAQTVFVVADMTVFARFDVTP